MASAQVPAGSPREAEAEGASAPQPAPHTLPGGASYTISTTPAHDGTHLANIHCVAVYPSIPPAAIFALLTSPLTVAAGVWRDVKAQTERTVEAESHAAPGADPPHSDPPGSLGFRSVLVTQVGEVRLGIKTVRFETHLRVVEDGTGAGAGRFSTDFSLARPGGALRRFHGRWALEPDGAGGGTRAVLTQEVCPTGVPPGLNYVPLVGRLVRGACSRAVRRMVEDLAAAVSASDGAEGGVEGWLEGRAAAREGMKVCLSA